jgi:thymidylate synthase (FAD)
MKVKLLSYSQLNPFLLSSVEESPIALESIRDLVAFCARVSNPSNQMNMDTSEKLLKYLIKHKHWSPFELVSLCLEITTTRDIARQILRHRSFSFQEFSQRYANPLEDLQFVTREARLQDTKNRQNSIIVDDEDLQHEWTMMQEDVIRVSRRVYEWALSKGIAKEQARAVLPEGLTESRLYMNGTLRSWIHYCELRSANGTQLEHMEIAKACAEAIAMVFPQIKDITNEH